MILYIYILKYLRWICRYFVIYNAVKKKTTNLVDLVGFKLLDGLNALQELT